MWDLDILYADRFSKAEQALIRQFCEKPKKYERGGQLKVKIHIWFYGDKS
jgi:hypothetical protein